MLSAQLAWPLRWAPCAAASMQTVRYWASGPLPGKEKPSGSTHQEIPAESQPEQPASAPAAPGSSSGGMLKRFLPQALLRLLPGSLTSTTLQDGPAAGSRLPKPSRITQPPADERQPPAATRASKKEAADAEKTAKTAREEALKGFADLCEMDVDGYSQLCSQQLAGLPEPSVQLPPVPMWHVDYIQHVDYRRANWLRTRQHMQICNMMSSEQKEAVLAQGHLILKDISFLQQVAGRTRAAGREYMELEVRDCLGMLLDYRELGARMVRWVDTLGQPVPATDDQREDAIEAIKQLEALEWYQQRLEGRSKATCQLHAQNHWAGPSARCPATLLPYAHCCGSKPLPLPVALCYMGAEREGLSLQGALFRIRLEKVSRLHERSRLLGNHRQPRSRNHLLPLREGEPRQEAHKRGEREQLRSQLEPKLDKTARKMF